MSRIRTFRSWITAVMVVLGIGLVTLAPAPALAFSPFSEACDGSSASAESSVCRDKNFNSTADPTDPQSGIIGTVTNIIAAVGGIIAVVFMMVNGFKFMTSTGDSAKVAKARESVIYAAIGLVVIVLARIIIAFISRFI